MDYSTIISTVAMVALLVVGAVFSIWMARHDHLEVR